MFGQNWKGKIGAIVGALFGIVAALLPESAGEIQERLAGAAIAFGGLSVYGIREALGKMTIAGKIGPALVALSGLVRVLFPAAGPLIDTVLPFLGALGAGIGLTSVRAAQGMRTAPAVGR